MISGTKKEIEDLKAQIAKKDQKIKNICLMVMVFCCLGLICLSFLTFFKYEASQSLEKFCDYCLDLEKQVKKAEHHLDSPKKTATGWNAMEVGFISPDAIIERGAIVEPGAFVFPKAVIRSGAVGKKFI